MKKRLKACALLLSLLWAAPSRAETISKTWTLDADFDRGVLDSVNHSAPNNHQLQLDSSSRTDPYIWIANTWVGTVTKMDTRTGRQLAKYDSVLQRNWDGSIPAVRPPRDTDSGGYICNSPSPTAVDGNGNAFVVNEGRCQGDSASVTKYAFDLSGCVDRNGNGVIDTSRDLDNDGIISMASAEFLGQADECILWTKNYAQPGDLGRSAAVDADQNLWVADYNTSKLYKLNGTTGALMKVINPRAQTGRNSYIFGIAIGPGGFIYTSDMILMKIDPNRPSGTEVVGTLDSPVATYGLAVDANNIVWLGIESDSRSLVRADFAAGTATLLNGVGICHGPTRGVAVDGNGDVWTASWSAGRVLRFNSAGVYLGCWPTGPLGFHPLGVAVDSDGRIWAVNFWEDTVIRYDPATGNGMSFPTTGEGESYSDMTGFQHRNFTTRQGDWTAVHDSGQLGTTWGPVAWNTEPQGREPAGTSLTVEVRAADTLAMLATTPYLQAANGLPIMGLAGRFIEIRAMLRIQAGDTSPVLSDLSVTYPPPPCFQVQLSDYNLFLLEDYNLGTKVEGKVAAGGDVTLNDFSVGHRLPGNSLANTLVAGGSLSLTHGAVWGETLYGSDSSADSTVLFPRSSGAQQGTPIDFVARGIALRLQSFQLANLPANGAMMLESSGGIMLSGTRPGVNVFEVPASAFNTASLLSIDAPADSLVVINITGRQAAFSGFGHSFSGGIDTHGVLYNFTEATSILAHRFDFLGTVLAPYARVHFSNGSWHGGMYARSLTGSAEGVLNVLYDHDICW